MGMKNKKVILDPRTRLLVLLLFTWLVFACEAPVKLGMTALIGLSLSLVTGDSARQILRTIRPLFFLVVALLALQLLVNSRPPYYRWAWLVISQSALREVTITGLRLLIVLWLAAWSTHDLPVNKVANITEWLLSPLKALGIKTDSISLAMAVAIRLLPEMQKEAHLIDEGQRLRGKRPSRGNPLVYSRELLNLLVPLMARAILRADQMADAILARGYGIADHPESLEELRFGKQDIAFVCLLVLIAGYIAMW